MLAVALARRKMSAGAWISPLVEHARSAFRRGLRCRARRATKWRSRSNAAPGRSGRRCSGRPPCPHHLAHRMAAADRADVRESRTAGNRAAASPADADAPAGSRRRRAGCDAVADRARPCGAISSSLWSVALVTTTPPTVTGVSRATGVSVPVRPTWMSMPLQDRRSPARRGTCARSPSAARATTKPSRSCRSSRSTL